MKLINGIENFVSHDFTCVSVGTFDGLHFGHQAIINSLKSIATDKNLKSCVVTFHPHPRTVLFADKKANLILSQEDKIKKISDSGIDYLVIVNFTKQIASLTASDFLSAFLVDKLHMKYLVSGFNNHFGCDRTGDISQLSFLGSKFGFEVTKAPALCNGDKNFSSTLLREAVSQGDFESFFKSTGYYFPLSGIVVHGRHQGRYLGFPTANISDISKDIIIPDSGAYATFCLVNGVCYQSMTNVGNCPTLTGGNMLTVETNIFDFSGDIYLKPIKIYFVKKIRDEQKFRDADQLSTVLSADKITTKKILSDSKIMIF